MEVTIFKGRETGMNFVQELIGYLIIGFLFLIIGLTMFIGLVAESVVRAIAAARYWLKDITGRTTVPPIDEVQRQIYE